MSEKQYGCAMGFAQFEARQRDTSAGSVRDINIRAFGSQKTVGINLFENQWGHVQIGKGDLVAADGSFTQTEKQNDDGSSTVYINITPFHLNVNGVKQTPKPRDTVNTGTTSAPASSGASTEAAPF